MQIAILILFSGLASRVADYKTDQNLNDDVIMSSKIFVIIHKSGYSPNTYEEELPERFYSRPTVKMQFIIKKTHKIYIITNNFIINWDEKGISEKQVL